MNLNLNYFQLHYIADECFWCSWIFLMQMTQNVVVVLFRLASMGLFVSITEGGFFVSLILDSFYGLRFSQRKFQFSFEICFLSRISEDCTIQSRTSLPIGFKRKKKSIPFKQSKCCLKSIGQTYILWCKSFCLLNLSRNNKKLRLSQIALNAGFQLLLWIPEHESIMH